MQVPLGSRKQRALLAILLLRANEVVAPDALIDELWGERPPPARAPRTRCRSTFPACGRRSGRAAATTESSSRARRATACVWASASSTSTASSTWPRRDAERSLPAHPNVRPSGCAMPSRSGVADLLADLAFEPFARIDVERLEELRLAALEDRIDADLALGRHTALVAELERLVAQHPLRERLRGQLMLALYRAAARPMR